MRPFYASILLLLAGCLPCLAGAQLELLSGVGTQSSRPTAVIHAPVSLGLISESAEAAKVADVLTARLSADTNIHLLERDQIAKIYREQGLASVNQDYLKLGQMLGADGLLILNVVKTSLGTNMEARLIAVKPGVILSDSHFAWPFTDLSQWAEAFATHLGVFLPKLSLLVKDVIPISVVNLRSAVQSKVELEAEEQLKLLAIERLSREPQFFVLERERMQLLGEEKNLKLDESAFWNGSYLLEGVVDQNGYSQETITINVRLTPPKGHAPVSLAVSGSRTNFAEVINSLAKKVAEALKLDSTVKEWNAADEAKQFYDEAIWALRWGVMPEAREAADSAWVLGNHDMDCATARIRAYLAPMDRPIYEERSFGGLSSLDEEMGFINGELKLVPHLGLRVKAGNWGGHWFVDYAYAKVVPDSRNVELASQGLRMYLEFSQARPRGEIITNLFWYTFGLGNLENASKVLQQFSFVPESQQSAGEQLAELRSLSRSVADYLLHFPGIRDSYFVGDRLVTRDTLYEMTERPNIFRYETTWGCFWQDKPEDCIAMYRELMTSPAFCYIHGALWARDLLTPRVVAWNPENQQQIPQIWANFMQELENSTNLLLRLEAKAITVADAANDKDLTNSAEALLKAIFENRDALVANKTEVVFAWGGMNSVFGAQGSFGSIAIQSREELNSRFYRDYSPKFNAMVQEYWNKTIPAAQGLAQFEKQIEFFNRMNPADFLTNQITVTEFMGLFGMPNDTKEQALTVLPKMESLRTNLEARVAALSGKISQRAKANIHVVSALEDRIGAIVNPPPVNKTPAAVSIATNSVPVPKKMPEIVSPVPAPVTEVSTNILMVRNYFEFPVDMLRPGKGQEASSQIFLPPPSLIDGKLWFDLYYEVDNSSHIYVPGQSPFAKVFSHTAAAAYDPPSGKWEVYDVPEPQSYVSNAPEFTKPLGNSLFVSGRNYLWRFDFKSARWEKLSVPWQEAPALFPVGQRLLASNSDSIFEILDGGNKIGILASTRRHPAVSILDSAPSLSFPRLVEGPGHSLCAVVASSVFRWDGTDWREMFRSKKPGMPHIAGDAIFIQTDIPDISPRPRDLSIWNETEVEPIFCLHEDEMPMRQIASLPRIQMPQQRPPGAPPPGARTPLWNPLPGESLLKSASTSYRSNLYFFVEHASIRSLNPGLRKLEEKDGCHAKLVSLIPGIENPLVLPLKFEVERGDPPLKLWAGNKGGGYTPWWLGAILSDAWILFVDDKLYFGQPNMPGIWTLPVSEIEAALAVQKLQNNSTVAKPGTNP